MCDVLQEVSMIPAIAMMNALRLTPNVTRTPDSVSVRTVLPRWRVYVSQVRILRIFEVSSYSQTRLKQLVKGQSPFHIVGLMTINRFYVSRQ